VSFAAVSMGDLSVETTSDWAAPCVMVLTDVRADLKRSTSFPSLRCTEGLGATALAQAP
jgi:hypothetical protein